MASNPTPSRLSELIAAGEDFCDGLTQHGVAIGVKQNTFAVMRADLDALIAAKNAVSAAEGAQPALATALRLADSNAKGFIAASVKVLSLSLGNAWSDLWEATGLPDNVVGVPRTQDGRFTALGGLVAYFTANAGKEVASLNVTAAVGTTLHTALGDARQGVANGLTNTKTKVLAQEAARDAFKMRYRGGIDELEQLLGDEDPRWYDFGLNRPADPATPGVPSPVLATALGSGRVLIQVGGARRANSFSYYQKVSGTPAEPTKILNTENTQHTLEGQTPGVSLEITVIGVNEAGPGQPSAGVTVVVT